MNNFLTRNINNGKKNVIKRKTGNKIENSQIDYKNIHVSLEFDKK